jgi:regulator of telomere elongation helicase 1
VIIFDEAHNIEQQCEDAASVMIRSLDLAGCLDDITHVMQWMIDSKSPESELAIPTDDKEENNIDAKGK